jgi:DNA repair exonuclease SbcCD ATPase subunit
MAERADLDTRITRISADNTRLAQANQELTQALAEQERTRMAERGDLDARLARISADNARLIQANQELTQALAEQERTTMAEKGDLDARLGRLSADNTRLTQANQELTQALAEQERTTMAERGDLDARIARLSADNARLTQANQELSQALAAQNQKITLDYQSQLTALREDNRRLRQRVEEQVSTLSKITEEGNKTADAANTYIALTNAYARYTATPGEGGDMESFFDTPEVDHAFPGFFDRLTDMNKQIAQDAYHEGIANAATIIETALRIPQQDTRIKYLEGVQERYRGDPHMSTLITMLLSRL